MNDFLQEILYELSKEQLVYLIERHYNSMLCIGETCADESKMHISSENAVNNIRECIYTFPMMLDTEKLKNYLDWEMGNISTEEYRKILGLD